jgi:hypothetical protein
VGLRTAQGDEVSARTVYYPIVLVPSPGSTLMVAEENQPPFEEFTVPPQPRIGEKREEWEARQSSASMTVRVERRDDAPLRFVVVP